MSQPGSKNQKKQAPSSMHRIMAQFELNLSHAIQATPNKIFHAFFVPYDGHCLFQAFKSSLNIQTSVQDLRTQMVNTISDQTNPQIRISALNAHIAREAEHVQSQMGRH